MSKTAQNDLAKHFKSLHHNNLDGKGYPLILTNAYDALSARAILSFHSSYNATTSKHQSCPAIATASAAIALSRGIEDGDLDMDTNLEGSRAVNRAIRAFSSSSPSNKNSNPATTHAIPLTLDLQDGYGPRLEEAVVRSITELGAVGANIEDCGRIFASSSEGEDGDGTYRRCTGEYMLSLTEATSRIRKVLDTAASQGVPDFVVNARCDALRLGSSGGDGDDEVLLSEVVARGKAYLEAGATTIFVWGGPGRGLRNEEVGKLVREFGGRLAVSMRLRGEGMLGVEELTKMGVARISVGPQLQALAIQEVGREVGRILGSRSS